jgi:hypothetical protein
MILIIGAQFPHAVPIDPPGGATSMHTLRATIPRAATCIYSLKMAAG